MGTLLLRNIPDHLHALLKTQARRNRRSLSDEVVSLIKQALAGQRTVVELPPPIELKGGQLTIADIESAIAAGRD
jgi:plasmid stability protein